MAKYFCSAVVAYDALLDYQMITPALLGTMLYGRRLSPIGCTNAPREGRWAVFLLLS